MFPIVHVEFYPMSFLQGLVTEDRNKGNEIFNPKLRPSQCPNCVKLFEDI